MKFQKLAKDKSSLVRVFSISVLVTQRQRETSGSRIGEVTAGCVAAPVKCALLWFGHPPQVEPGASGSKL